MCRLFGVISPDRLTAEFPWLNAPTSLLKLSHIDKKRPQADGWGTAWYSAGRPHLIKSPRAVFRDLSRLRGAVRKSKGEILLGHIRWASNPLKLPKRELIGLRHSQPFRHRDWTFIHNGTLYIPREVKAALGPWARFVKGNNDSEVLFYWLLKTVASRPGDWAKKTQASLRGLDRIWAGCKARYPLFKFPYHGLNWVLTNGRVLIAFSYVDPRGLYKGKALSRPEQPYYQLQTQETPRRVTVASEPLTPEPNWRPLGHGRMLVAETRGQSLKYKTVKVA